MISEELPQKLMANMDTLLPLIIEHGLSFSSALLILVLGFWFSGRARNLTIKALKHLPNFDMTLQSFFGSVVRYVVIIFTVLAVLAKFGVQTASLIAVLGAAGLAVGLALQGTLSNVAAGVMLLIFRPFKAGDYVEVAGGVGGTIVELSLFTTEMVTPDNLCISMPNSEIWNSPVKNYSHHATRRLDIVIGISYGDDIGKAIAALQDVADKDERVLKDPAPFAAVSALGASSVDMLLRVWMKNSDYWPVRFDLTRAAKERMDAEGITIPFPTVTQYNVEVSSNS
ncbi:MAG: mechanosensitive ion channel domain-containing protein [Parvibaculum sp.]